MNGVDVMNGKKKPVTACKNAIILYDVMRNNCKMDRKGKDGFEPLLITAITVFRLHIT